MEKKICAHEGCIKKLKLVELNIKCKCNNVYCSEHRYYTDHNCCYDYKKDNNLENKLVLVVSDKVNKI